MDRMTRISQVIMAGLIMVRVLVAPANAQLMEQNNGDFFMPPSPPIALDHKGSSVALERPVVRFNHDLHTKALPQIGKENCGVCHLLKKPNQAVHNTDVAVFKFPKDSFDASKKTAIMAAYHGACGSCHHQMASEGKRSGPNVGQCGKCHRREAETKKASWTRDPIFNYGLHYKHLNSIDKTGDKQSLVSHTKVEIMGPVGTSDGRCSVCHHIYDDLKKKLIYKKDCENSCKACHKSSDEANVRSVKNVAHAACLGCHLSTAEQVRSGVDLVGKTGMAEQGKRRFGPLHCGGCHGDQKELKPEETAKIPRLVRGQKDMMDLALVMPAEAQAGSSQSTRMKSVPFNHKSHEPRTQFCSTCHHHSLEKCSNCHTLEGDLKKGGGVTYERAFHSITAKQACTGCHESTKQEQKCAGCHQQALSKLTNSSCPVCHRGPSDGKPVETPALPLVFDKERVPEKVVIKSLEKEFKPADLPHQKIVTRLTEISNRSPLARVFHSSGGQDALCAGCHHKMDFRAAQSKKVPACTSCHGRPFNPMDLNKPGILGAYHRQCIGCHESMKQKPAALECVKCHPAKGDDKTAEVTGHR